MGCGASKSLDSGVIETTQPATVLGQAKVAPEPILTQVDAVDTDNPTTTDVTTSQTVTFTTGVSAAPAAVLTADSANDAKVETPTRIQRPSSSQSRKDGHTALMAVRGAGDGYEMDSETGVAPSAERIKKDEAIVTPKGANLTWNVIPSIPYVSTAEAAQGTHKAVAFEIPLDEELKAKPAEDVDTKIAKEIEVAKPTAKAAKATEVKSAPVKVSLPKLALSDQDIQAKLANMEARWKDIEFEQAERRKHRRRGAKPTLGRSSKRVDPEILKQRLIEKEAAASENRAREISRMQSKLARQDEHARRVLQRKRALGRLSTEDLNLSWGGEDGLETLELSLEEEVRRPKTAACDFDDVDSGNGSSLGSRSGSGRSVGTNGEIIEDMKAIQVAPLQDRYRIISQ